MIAEPSARPPRRHRWVWAVVLTSAAILAALGSYVGWPSSTRDSLSRARLWTLGVRDGTARVGPYKVHYLAAGSGHPIILLHGLAGQGLQWGDYIPLLAKDGRVYAPDLLGFGRSDRPDVDYSTPLQTEVLREFMDSQGIGRADLVGSSMGGWIAANFARLHPDRVRRLVLANAVGVGFDPATPEPFVPRSAAELPRLMDLLTPRASKVPGIIASGIVREMQPLVPVVERHLQNRRRGIGALDGQLGGLTMPVLLLWGAEDRVAPLAVASEFQREIPHSRLVILENCGHIAAYDCRSHAQPEIRSFLTAVQPEQGGVRSVTVPR